MKKKNILVIYFIIIVILLALIMFIIPDDFFLSKYENIDLPTTNSSTNETIKKEFLDYEKQIENLLNNNYSFEYHIMDSMGTKTYVYTCTGTKEGTNDYGTCTGADNFSYNEENKDDNFKIDTKYLNLENIFNLISTVEPELTSENDTREYLYNVKIDNLDTEIIVYTDLFDITKIEISNAYMVYLMKFIIET